MKDEWLEASLVFNSVFDAHLYIHCLSAAGSHQQLCAGLLHWKNLPVSDQSGTIQRQSALPSAHGKRDGSLRM